jgi:flagellar biosynthesis protein FlhA
LAVGDGLVSQLPALLISTAAGIVVTRAASGTDLGSEVTSQMLLNPRVLAMVSGILASLALLPGLPFLPFVALAGALGGLSYAGREHKEAIVAQAALEARTEAPKEERSDVPAPLDLLELEVGYELVPLVDASQRGELIERIKSLRKQLAEEMGFVVPPVHIRDNLQLKPGEYAILLKGVEIQRAEIRIGQYLAINPGGADPGFRGVPTKEPAFGLEALWVMASDREQAQLAGYTVVDAATVVVTHLTELIRRHAHELLGRQEVQGLLESLAKSNPKVVEELVPQQLTLGQVQKVLQNLLREHFGIRDSCLRGAGHHARATQLHGRIKGRGRGQSRHGSDYEAAELYLTTGRAGRGWSGWRSDPQITGGADRGIDRNGRYRRGGRGQAERAQPDHRREGQRGNGGRSGRHPHIAQRHGGNARSCLARCRRRATGHGA